MTNIEQVKSELRKEVRALKIEEKLNGYMLVHWIDGIAADDTMQLLIPRVLRMAEPALVAVSQRTGYSFRGASLDVLTVLGEEAHRVIQLMHEQDERNLQTVVEAGLLTSTAAVQ
jgi:hypothetical protein